MWVVRDKWTPLLECDLLDVATLLLAIDFSLLTCRVRFSTVTERFHELVIRTEDEADKDARTIELYRVAEKRKYDHTNSGCHGI